MPHIFKGTVIFFRLVSDQYSVSAATRIWVSELVKGILKTLSNINTKHMYISKYVTSPYNERYTSKLTQYN